MPIQCMTVLFCILTLIGVIIMIAVGATVVREYNLAKTFKPTECRLLDTSELGFRTCQYCYTTSTSTRRAGRHERRTKTKCRPSSFPCVRMTVSYYDDYRVNRTATYHPDVLKMTQSLLCSFYVCGRSPYNNEIEVMQHVKAFQTTSRYPFPCYYSNENQGQVIGKKIHTYNEAFHGMLWPGLIAGIGLLGVVVTLCGWLKKKKSNTESTYMLTRDDQCEANGTSHHAGSAYPEKMPLSGPTVVPPAPFDMTNPQPIPTQPYYPGGPPVYPPATPKDYPNPGGDQAYPPQGGFQGTDANPMYPPPPQGPSAPTYQPQGPNAPTYQPHGPNAPTYQPQGPSAPTYQPQGPNAPTYPPQGPTAPTYPPQGPSAPSYPPQGPNTPMYPTPSSPPPQYGSMFK